MSTSLEALRRHRAIHADDPESRPGVAVSLPRVLRSRRAKRVAEARAFMDVIIRTFAETDHLEVHGFIPFPAGPHRRGSFDMSFTREAFADHVSWLMFSRPSWLDILVHPLTRSQLPDHTRRALWLGTPLEIDCAIRSEESSIEGTKTHGRRRAG